MKSLDTGFFTGYCLGVAVGAGLMILTLLGGCGGVSDGSTYDPHEGKCWEGYTGTGKSIQQYLYCESSYKCLYEDKKSTGYCSALCRESGCVVDPSICVQVWAEVKLWHGGPDGLVQVCTPRAYHRCQDKRFCGEGLCSGEEQRMTEFCRDNMDKPPGWTHE